MPNDPSIEIFKVGDWVEWNNDFLNLQQATYAKEWLGEDWRGYLEVVSVGNGIVVKNLSTGNILTRLSGGFAGANGFNHACFKKVDKFKVRLKKIYDQADQV